MVGSYPPLANASHGSLVETSVGPDLMRPNMVL